jgi:hypothetical protein
MSLWLAFDTLLNLAAELAQCITCCKVMALSRDTFYRYQSAMESVI